jgi:hypothetical protein
MLRQRYKDALLASSNVGFRSVVYQPECCSYRLIQYYENCNGG